MVVVLSMPLPFVRRIPPVSDERVIVPLEVMPVAATIAPLLFTWNASPAPTVSGESGDVSPIPTLPEKYELPVTSKILLNVEVALFPTSTEFAVSCG